jgi:hypothetical protein
MAGSYAKKAVARMIQWARDGVVALSRAVAPLTRGDAVTVTTEFGADEMGVGGADPTDRFSRDLTAEEISNESVEIFKIKKPDFLGDSQWEFRLGRESFPASVGDGEWLDRFRGRRVPLLPGDALKVRVKTTTRFGHDGEALSTRREIRKLLREIRLPAE